MALSAFEPTTAFSTPSPAIPESRFSHTPPDLFPPFNVFIEPDVPQPIQPLYHEVIMKATICALVLALLFVSTTSGVMAQEKKKKKMPSQEEMMKRWQEVMTPGDPHKKLEAYVGSWDAEVKMWMAGPSGEPNVSKGTAEYTMALGGRFVQQDVTGEMMGQPMKGIGITGYDNFRKKYVGFWIDNFGTGMYTMEGSMSKDGTTLTMMGKMDEPMTGEKDKKVKYVTRWIDKDTHVFESYDVAAYGDKKPVMVITYTRKK